jgi:MFS family permease
MEYKWKAFTVVALSLFVMVMDASALNVILPQIAEDFEVSLGTVSWVTIIGGLAISSTLLPLGKLADITGRRRIQLIGMSLFALGTIICFFSTNISTLLIGRIVGSIGSSMLQAVTMAIVLAVFPSNEKGRGLGMITFAVGIGGIAGPLLGSQITEFFGWKYIFLVMFFPTIIGFIMAIYILKDELIGSSRDIKVKYDFKGAIYSALFIILIILNISNPFNFSYFSAIYWIIWIISISLIYLFIKSQIKNKNPMFNLRLFLNWRFSFAISARLFGFTSNGPFWFIIPFYATIVLKYSVGMTGILIFLNALGMSISGSIAGRLSDKFGTIKFIITGLTILSMTWLLFIIAGNDSPKEYILLLSLFNGISNGLWMAPNTSETLEKISTEYQGLISAFNALIRNIGSVMGISVSTILITSVLISNGLNVQIGDLINGSKSEIKILTDAMNYSFAVSAGFGILAIILSLVGKIRN